MPYFRYSFIFFSWSSKSSLSFSRDSTFSSNIEVYSMFAKNLWIKKRNRKVKGKFRRMPQNFLNYLHRVSLLKCSFVRFLWKKTRVLERKKEGARFRDTGFPPFWLGFCVAFCIWIYSCPEGVHGTGRKETSRRAASQECKFRSEQVRGRSYENPNPEEKARKGGCNVVSDQYEICSKKNMANNIWSLIYTSRDFFQSGFDEK